MSGSCSSPNPLVPGLIGGVIGAALAGSSHRAHAAQLERRIDEIKSLEESCLAEKQQLHRLKQSEARRNETERSYHHAVVWLSHCNNEERLDHLIARNQPALTGQFASLLATEVERDPFIASRLRDLRETHLRLAAAQQDHRARERQRAVMRSSRWTFGSVFANGLLFGCVSGIPALLVIGVDALPYLLLYGVLLALFSPTLAAQQPTPSRFRSRAEAPREGNFATFLARTELLNILRGRELVDLAAQFRARQEELRRQLNQRQSEWLAAAAKHAGALRPQLEALQQAYPPRVRCDLRTIPDEAIAQRLREALAPAFAEKRERMLHP